MQRFHLINFPIKDKIVFYRTDYNVPIKAGKVEDNYKIRATLPTIKFLLKNNCKIIIGTHLGRPKGKFVSKLKLDPIAKTLRELLPKKKIIKLNKSIGPEVKNKIKNSTAQIILLENLRFYAEEENNESFFAHSLANLTQIYINDAFADSHRKHASIQAITKFLPSIAGFLFEKEIHQLNKALYPQKPVVWILGGAKLQKTNLLQSALKKANQILIGGALCFSFLRAKGFQVGSSLTDQKTVRIAKNILNNKKNHKKIVLPIDFAAASSFSARAKMQIVKADQIAPSQICLDLGPETIKLFIQNLQKAKTIVWNGPLGYFEWEKFAKSTKEIGRFLAKTNKIIICGGGETSAAIRKFHLQDKITHLSTGGGATLNYLAGKNLPALESLYKNHSHFKRRIGKIKS